MFNTESTEIVGNRFYLYNNADGTHSVHPDSQEAKNRVMELITEHGVSYQSIQIEIDEVWVDLEFFLDNTN